MGRFLRRYSESTIRSDCVISKTAKENKKALRLMKRYLKAGTGPSQRISIGNESGFGTKMNRETMEMEPRDLKGSANWSSQINEFA